MSKHFSIFLLAGLCAFQSVQADDKMSLSAATTVAASKADCLVTGNSVGQVKIGDTLASIRKKIPNAKMKFTPRAELGTYTIDSPKYTVQVYLTDSGTGNLKKDEKKKIDTIELTDKRCVTAKGFSVGKTLADLEKLSGRKVTELGVSEVESKIYISLSGKGDGISYAGSEDSRALVDQYISSGAKTIPKEVVVGQMLITGKR